MMVTPCCRSCWTPFARTVVVNCPTKPWTLTMSAPVIVSMFAWLITRPRMVSTNPATSSPCQVFLTFSACPPNCSFSTKYVLKPWSARFRAALMPAMPPPMTSPAWFNSTWMRSMGSNSATLAAAMRTRSLAFSVAFSGSDWCTQESWSRMLASSNRYRFSPASRIVSWKRGSWVRGVHAATTTRLSWFSWMASRINFWVSWLHVNRLSAT